MSNYDKKFDDFIEGLDIPQLSEEDLEHLETELTLEELKDVLASFVNNKGKMDSQRNFTNPFLMSSGKIYLIHITRHFIKVDCQYPKEREY